MARTLPEICADARRSPCPHCEAIAGEICWPDPGVHIARIAEAQRLRFISGPDFLAVADAMTIFMWSTTVPDTGSEAA